MFLESFYALYFKRAIDNNSLSPFETIIQKLILYYLTMNFLPF